MPAPSWTDNDRWKQLVRGEQCPLCDRAARGGVIAELRACYAVVDSAVNVRGYCCLILKHHATELHDLAEAEARVFMGDIQRAARAVQHVTGAIKINYEIHGNVIPHVHMHLVPRYPGDPIESTGRTWHVIEESPYAAGEYDRFVRELTQALL
jgi:diadenosine tetraphosphate (Ap4A) HIT family hydrolase